MLELSDIQSSQEELEDYYAQPAGPEDAALTSALGKAALATSAKGEPRRASGRRSPG